MASLQDILGQFGFEIISRAEWDQEADDGRGTYRVGFQGPTIWMARAKSVTPRGLLTALADEFGYLEHELKLAAKAEVSSDIDADEVDEDNSAFVESVDIARIMDQLELPIEIEPTWDAVEGTARIDVRLAANSVIALWPRKNTPDGIAMELADELEGLAAGIREAVERRRVPANRNSE